MTVMIGAVGARVEVLVYVVVGEDLMQVVEEVVMRGLLCQQNKEEGLRMVSVSSVGMQGTGHEIVQPS